MSDIFRQRSIARKIEELASADSLVSLPHEAFIFLGVESMADYMISNDQDLINADEEFELDFSQEEFESILNECTSESTYAYFSGTSRLKVLGEVNKIDDRNYEVKFRYILELSGNELCICKDGVHYRIEHGESPYSKNELIDKIAEVYNTNVIGLIDQIDHESSLESLRFIKEYLENASEVDVYDIIDEHLSILDLWSDLIAASGLPKYDGCKFELLRSFVIDVSSID